MSSRCRPVFRALTFYPQYFLTSYELGYWLSWRRTTPLIFGHLVGAIPSSFWPHMLRKLADLYSEVQSNVSSWPPVVRHTPESILQLEHFYPPLNGQGVCPERYMAPSVQFLQHVQLRANMLIIVETPADEQTGLLCHGPAQDHFISPIDAVSRRPLSLRLHWIKLHRSCWNPTWETRP